MRRPEGRRRRPRRGLDNSSSLPSEGPSKEVGRTHPVRCRCAQGRPATAAGRPGHPANCPVARSWVPRVGYSQPVPGDVRGLRCTGIVVSSDTGWRVRQFVAPGCGGRRAGRPRHGAARRYPRVTPRELGISPRHPEAPPRDPWAARRHLGIWRRYLAAARRYLRVSRRNLGSARRNLGVPRQNLRVLPRFPGKLRGRGGAGGGGWAERRDIPGRGGATGFFGDFRQGARRVGR